jgi:hypothetical protein
LVRRAYEDGILGVQWISLAKQTGACQTTEACLPNKASRIKVMRLAVICAMNVNGAMKQ